MFRWLIWISLFVLGCNQRIISHVNNQASFDAYDTYRIVNYKLNKDEITQEGRLIYDQIEQNISDQMLRRGYQESNIDPDILIRYEIISNQVSDVTSTNYNPYFYNPVITIRTFLQSALLIELTDVQNEKLIWQASIDMSQYDRDKKQSEVIRAAVTGMYDTYLYKAGSRYPDESLKSQK